MFNIFNFYKYFVVMRKSISCNCNVLVSDMRIMLQSEHKAILVQYLEALGLARGQTHIIISEDPPHPGPVGTTECYSTVSGPSLLPIYSTSRIAVYFSV